MRDLSYREVPHRFRDVSHPSLARDFTVGPQQYLKLLEMLG
jgi:hypothetical protein